MANFRNFRERAESQCLTMRRKLFLACKVLNNLRLTDKIEFHNQTAEDLIPLFVEAIEDIDDQMNIDEVPYKIIDLYEVLIDDEDERTIELNKDPRKFYDKKINFNREVEDIVNNYQTLEDIETGRKRKKYQFITERNVPKAKKLTRKLDI